jgi:hypothetical protein
MLSPDNIAIPAHQSSLRESKAGFLRQLLGTYAQKLYPATQASGASLGYWHSIVAMMAYQGVFFGVIIKAYIATAALQYQATFTTLDKGSCSTPIEKQNNLSSVGDSFIYCLFKRAAENTLITCL